MYIDKANLDNLTGLWKKYGVRLIQSSTPPLYVNTHWPHRCWLDWGGLSKAEIQQSAAMHVDKNKLAALIPESAVVPVWPVTSNEDYPVTQHFEQLLQTNGWTCSFEQTAMYLDLVEQALPSVTDGFEVIPVNTLEAVSQWIEIGSDAFGYQIDRAGIDPLLNEPDIKLMLSSDNGEVAAGALMYKTGEVIGLHQLGVKKAFQGRGIARRFMQAMIVMSQQWQGRYLVLQASTAGLPLYESLGFKAQFGIRNYQRL